ncbi:MAG: ABC transporter permease [Burkholderiaceae bacterium]|jgi:phospholipid/cholesterol/gamma-HCH transport system permease protein|nr:ABC transporter permease [Burkholderiaceae bacterium]
MSAASDFATDPIQAPRIEHARGAVVVRGRWVALALAEPHTWRALSHTLEALPDAAAQAWDLRPIERLDHVGAQVLWLHWNGRAPAQLQATPTQRALLEQIARYTTRAVQTAPPARMPQQPSASLLSSLLSLFGLLLNRLGAYGARLFDDVQHYVQMLGQLVFDIGRLLRAPHRGPWRDFSGQLYHGGASALPITALVGLLIGVVLAYLTSQQLRQYGGEAFIVNILGMALVRELGPVLAAVLVAGRSGSSITAQIGVMRVTEELDAMRVMGIAHSFRLVMPRVLALALAMPLIALWTAAAALVGGMIAAYLVLNIDPAYFVRSLPAAVPISNVLLALGKSIVFGVLIALIACHEGLLVRPNTESLGRGTTRSVVVSITAVILVDALFAILFQEVGF